MPTTPEKQPRMARTGRAQATVLILALALMITLGGLAGCGKKRLTTTPRPGITAPLADTVRTEAEQAWADKNWARAETLYQRLLDIPNLEPSVEAEAWGRLASAALHSGHAHIALDALDRQGRVEPATRNDWPWHEMAVDALEALGMQAAAAARLRAAMDDTSLPDSLRAAAGLRLARALWDGGDMPGAMDALAGLYRQFPEPAGPSWQEPRARMEAALFKELAAVDQTTLDALTAPSQAAPAFPHTIVDLERFRRMAAMEPVPALAWNLMRRLSEPGLFANPSLVQEVMGPLAERRTATARGMVLALPLTGQYARIGWKILRGAGAAHWDLATAGNVMGLRVVNTEAPGWLDELASLPPDFTLVGGPLRAENLERMQSRGLTRRHPVFTFMPRPGSLIEGVDAWRFFTGPGDQVRSLVSFAVNAMGIQRMAMLHPDEPFGMRLSERFWGEAIRQGALVRPVLSYPPKDAPKWAAKVAELLDVQPSDKEGQDPMPPDPGFEAVFLPDGWSQAQLLVPQFFFYEEDRLLLLGPSLWGQGLESDEHVEGRYFRLAVYPTAFAAENPSPGAEALRRAMDSDGLGAPDFWTSLGYDFVRFAGSMGPLPESWTPAEITAAARQAQAMDWSMAPMAWDQDGKASQDLFLMQPTDHGPVPVDPERLLKRREWIVTKHEERVEALLEKRELQDLLDRQEQLGITPDKPQDAPLTPEQMRINARVMELQGIIEQRAREREQGEQR